MVTWFDIKRAAIRMNLDRNENGQTVDHMLEQVRLLIAQNGYQFTGPTPTSTGGHEFRTKDDFTLEYNGASNTWHP
jgi:hypothetical protein